MTKKLRRVRINRKNWANGGSTDQKAMCNEHGRMCCLGFAMNQITRATKARMIGCNYPADVNYERPTFLTQNEDGYSCYDNNSFAMEAADINDDNSLSNEQRESKLIKLFGKNGIILEFTGEYDPIFHKEV